MLKRLRWRDDSGQDLVEYALVFPVLMLITLGIIEIGILVFSYNTIASAAREGARYGIIHPEDTYDIEEVVRDRALALDLSELQVAPTWDNRTIRVEVSYEMDLLTGPFVEIFGGNPTVRMTTAATMYREQ